MAESINQLPTLRQLTYLLALQDHQHFGRAAAACAVTQSTMSMGLAELERTLDVRLVERTKRSLRFTDLGVAVAERAREVLRAAADLVETARTPREPLSGPLRLAVIPTVAPFLLPRLFEAAAIRWPNLRLHAREMLTGAACEALQRNTVDCALLALPAECGDVFVSEICEDELLFAARYDLVPGEGALLDSEGLLLLDEGHCLRDHALTACNLAEAAPDAPLVATSLETLVRMVDAGLGATLLPRMAVDAGLLQGTCVTVRPSPARTHRKIALAWRKVSPITSDLHLLGQTIRDAVSVSN